MQFDYLGYGAMAYRIFLMSWHNFEATILVQWNGLNESGNQVASGIYIYRIQAGGFSDVKKVILLR